ncbi:MAG TPA: ATP-dependent zinc metalloprotease FtsH [Ignavibacteriales bacterium]|nr:ATP-dependent zinc metalloprotease FtsH [Ignavibacteriales bacterium]HPD67389.1 ATP-dependent zinc metalloprotease FtsH [Ignavibacteriales bacterium]HPP32914.1 ATP-dependent zinc metalloprotease FtsH [Ignavibacteriales bacterium]HRR18768.1 ATP-dependent zinc metalloprotease FtsH [Ignavibacteriales bacterium]
MENKKKDKKMENKEQQKIKRPRKKLTSNQDPNNQNYDWNKIIKSVVSWGLVILAAVVFLQLSSDGSSGYNISYEQYKQLLNEDKIAYLRIEKSDLNDYTVYGKLKEDTQISVQKNKKLKINRFQLFLPEPVLAEEKNIWSEKKIGYTFEKVSNQWLNLFYTIIPWALLIFFWFFLMRRMQGGGAGSKGLFTFGQSRARLINNSQNKVTFQDVAGADEAKVELQEIIEFLREPEKFQKLGGKIPKGVLLLGPPGTGKTLLGRAVAGEAGVPFFTISGADFVEMFVGVGASRVRDLFEQAKKNAPCIVFIDEIDAVGRQRGAGLGGGHDEREQTLNQLLVEMDGFEQNSGVIVMAATNRPDVLDPALLRPGRFDRQVVVDRPDVKGREGILKVHTKKVPLDSDVDIKILAKGTPGLSGADLANLVNEAALLAARKNKTKVSMSDFEEAKDKVMMGVERKSMIMSEQEKKTTAYHECGHVLVAKLIPESDPVHKVTIIPRGRALGVTTYLPMDERHSYSKKYIEAHLASLLGGRAAELIVFGEFNTGAQNDIERATKLAKKMVCEWGMSEKLGPLAYGSREEEIFLGREITKHKDYSEKTAEAIDAEVKRIVDDAMNRAMTLLKENIDTLHRLAKYLLEREILDAEEIDAIIKGEELPENNNSKSIKSSESEELPEHVKELLEKRKKEKETSNTENTVENNSENNSDENKEQE